MTKFDNDNDNAGGHLYPWWEANRKWLEANRARLGEIGRDEFLEFNASFMGNPEVVEGRAGTLVPAAIGMLRRGPQGPSEEAAREILCSKFVNWSGGVEIPFSQEVLDGLLASAGSCFEGRAVLSGIRKAIEADADYGIQSLIDEVGTADGAARTARGKEIEAGRAKDLGVVRAAMAVNFEVARNVLSVLRSFHVLAFGDEGLHPPGGPLSRRVGDLPGAKDGPEDMSDVPALAN